MNINTVILSLGNRNIEINSLNLSITDDSLSKNISCRLIPMDSLPNGRSRPLPLPIRPLVLWSGEDYDNIGDWTQAQAENRVLDLLGSDIQKTLLDLLQPKRPQNK